MVVQWLRRNNYSCNKWILSTSIKNEYKARHVWVGKVIHGELCKTLNLGLYTIWCMHKPESGRVNKMHKISLDFDKQNDHLILPKGLHHVVFNKRKKIEFLSCEFCHFSKFQSKKKKESEMIDKYLDLTRGLDKKKLWNIRISLYLVCLERTSKTERIRKQRRIGNCWNWPEFWEESWRPEETNFHSDSSEMPTLADGKGRFRDSNGSSNLSQKTRPRYSLYKKRTCRVLDFAVPADYRVKLKES